MAFLTAAKVAFCSDFMLLKLAHIRPVAVNTVLGELFYLLPPKLARLGVGMVECKIRYISIKRTV